MTEKVDERIKQVVAGKYGGQVPYGRSGPFMVMD
jgi:hypothetical protein